MKKYLFILLAVLVILSALAGCDAPDAGEGETPDAGETPDNPETSDAFVVAIVTVAMIALAGVVVSKKVRA